ncbi:hypothetical protein GZL_08653 [Streptomyces sp. 769]|nr:hypothetical protein GZL_08653 [Streptomyces sp. 769]
MVRGARHAPDVNCAVRMLVVVAGSGMPVPPQRLLV